jgi:type 1 glutamine amidotransferase
MKALLVIFGLLAASLEGQPVRKKILAIGEVQGFQHDSVSHGLATLERLGRETELWDTYIRTDCQLITKKKLEGNAKNLDYFDAVVFYTTGELKMDDQQKADLLSFVKDDGKGFIGIHSATDTFYQWPEYGEMIGGYFDEHPWGTFNAPVIVEDQDFPGMQQFPPEFVILDEIYQYKNYSRDKVRVLMRLDASKLDLTNPKVHRTDNDFAVGWVKNYGNGRVYYSNLGHREETYDRPDIQKMFNEGIKWALKLADADATPRPLP